MSTATAHAGTDWGSIIAAWWWAALIFGGAILGWIGEACDAGLTALHRRSKRRHKRRMDLKRIDLQIAIAQVQAGMPPSLPKPGPCVHRNVRPVIAADDELVGWLCACDAQLPADWAVREEDL
jgi:hypothetical protein